MDWTIVVSVLLLCVTYIFKPIRIVHVHITEVRHQQQPEPKVNSKHRTQWG